MSAFKVALPLVGAMVAWSAYSCSPEAGGSRGSGEGNAGFGALDASMNTGGGFIVGAGGFDPVFQGTGASRGTGGAGSLVDACGAVSAKPEQIIVYHDATLIDTIVTYTPIAIFLMQDRSSSMVGVLGDPSRWPNAQNAISAFVNDPSSAGLDVGLGFFPPTANNQGDCNTGTDCAVPAVPIGALPGNAAGIVNAMQTATPPAFPPLLTPTKCGVLGMIQECQRHLGATGEKCVAVLITDGEPTLCNETEPDPAVHAQTLAAIVAQGAAAGILTFAVALPGAQPGLPLLQQVATAGGTTLIDLTAGASSQAAILTALNSIRQAVTTRTESTVTTTTVIESKLQCQWGIPDPPDGGRFDKEKVNLTFTQSAGGVIEFAYVKSQAECAAAASSQAQAWYYDNPDSPTQVFACPHSCSMIENSSGARVDLQFGCERREPRFQ